MKHLNNHTGRYLLSFLMITGTSIWNPGITQQTGVWVAPNSAVSLVNPFQGEAEATKKGQKLYVQYCSVCHGDAGKGDGLAGMSLSPRPANFLDPKIKKQADGELYWKLTEGRNTMASYKSILTEEERWQLVNYIRELGN